MGVGLYPLPSALMEEAGGAATAGALISLARSVSPSAAPKSVSAGVERHANYLLNVSEPHSL